MKKLLIFLGIGFVMLVISFHGCKKEDPGTPGMNLVSLTSGTESLNRPVSDSVSTTFNIIAEFSNDIDYASIRDTTVLLYRDTTKMKLNFIVSGHQLVIDPVTDLLSGAFLTLQLTNRIKSTNGDFYVGSTIRIETAGLGVDTPPRSDKQLLYLQFNSSIQDITEHDTVASAKLGYTTDRFGIGNAAGNFRGGIAAASTGDIVELGGDSLITPSMSVSMWINLNRLSVKYAKLPAIPIFGLGAEKGYYFELGCDSAFRLYSITYETNHRLAAGGFYRSADKYQVTNAQDSVSILLKDGWHHVVVTYDEFTTVKNLYVDAALTATWTLSTANSGIGGMALDGLDTTKLAIGYYCDKSYSGSTNFNYATAFNTYLGALDDFRMYSVPLTAEEVMRIFVKESALK